MDRSTFSRSVLHTVLPSVSLSWVTLRNCVLSLDLRASRKGDPPVELCPVGGEVSLHELESLGCWQCVALLQSAVELEDVLPAPGLDFSRGFQFSLVSEAFEELEDFFFWKPLMII